MKSVLSLVIVLAIVLGGYYFYLQRAQVAGFGTNPTQAISLTGVQNDLLAIAQAERIYFTQNSAYASLSELTSSGALSFPHTGRDGYTYFVETSPGGFTVTARYQSRPGEPPGPRRPTVSVDQTMQVRQTD